MWRSDHPASVAAETAAARGPRRVVVVQTAYLGDLVLTTPLVREIARVCPAAALTIVTTAVGPEVFGGLAGVERIVPWDKRRAGLLGLVRLARQLRSAGYDVAVLAHRSHRSACLVRLAGIARRIGFAGAPGAWAYSETVVRDARRHAVSRYLALAAPLGGSPESADPRPTLGGLARAREPARRLLEAAGLAARPFVALAPGSVWPTKRWPPERFAEVARRARALGVEPLLVGSATDVESSRAVEASTPGGVASLVGGTSVGELAAVLERALAVVANDSGAAHVAAAVGTPVVAVFGPTVPAQGSAPLGARHVVVEHPALDCRPCGRHGARRCPQGHFRCMREIGAERVLEALLPLLDRAAPCYALRPG